MQTAPTKPKPARYDAIYTRPVARVPELINRLATLLEAERGGKWQATDVLMDILNRELATRTSARH